MTTQTLTALFDHYDEAAAAVTKLEAAGVPHGDISLVSNKGDTTAAGPDGTAEHAATGAGVGATLGTVLGGGAGLLAGLGLMAIPGVGPVVAAGWLVATLTGAGIGAAAGGLAGSLTGAGVSETDAHAYAEGVRRGGTLLTVRADETRAETAMGILEEHGALDLDERAQGWERDGWTGAKTNTVGSDTATLIGSDAAAGAPVRENAALSGTSSRIDAPASGARRVRVYNHPI
ncbi:hypothetical protein [uncultured Methylobacterium sp.]|uniref:hypothetical protein n=1 Tax=uncultured Methylobacterium sp. TaxID=157278 RepID=UPI0035CBCD74